MQKLSALEAYAMMTATKGLIFSVLFEKKDGEMRKMVCRLSVKKYLKGGELKYKPLEKLLMCVFDMQKQAYRMINLAKLRQLTIGGVTYGIA